MSPIYDCGAPDCQECENAFGPNRAMAAFKDRSRRYSKHVHVAGTTHGRPIDECAFCGLDLRNDVHSLERLS